MRKYLSVFLSAGALLLATTLPAQTLYKNVQKTTDGTNALVENLTVPSGKTLAGAGAFDFSGGTLTLGTDQIAWAKVNKTGSSLADLTTRSASDLTTGTVATARLYTSAAGYAIANGAALDSWAALTRAAGFDTFAATPSSANLRSLLTDETGTGLAYFQGGDAGTPSALVGTNITGTAAGLTAGNVTTNANLTGPITSTGNATSVAAQTGTGSTFVMASAPAIVGGSHTALTGLGLRSIGTGAFDLTLANAENLTAARTLTIQTGDASRTLVLGASPSLSGTNTGDQTITLTGDATGSGTGSFAVTVGKINGVSLAGLATGILKNTTTTGVPSIAVAGDFPTLNQSTTGSAATLTTPRAIYGNNFDGSAALTQVIASTYGGTGNGFTKFSGPATTEKTYTLPNSSETLLYSGGPLGTPSSGTATNLTGTSGITGTGALNSGSITSGFGAIDVGADSISGGALSVANMTIAANSSTTNAITFVDSATSGRTWYFGPGVNASGVTHFGLKDATGGGYVFDITSAGAATFLAGVTSNGLNAGSGAILGGGGLAVTGTATNTYSGAGAGATIQNSSDTSGTTFLAFNKSAGTAIGSITRVTTTDAVTYNTTSDARLKTNIRDFTAADSGRIIDALQPRWFDWRATDLTENVESTEMVEEDVGTGKFVADTVGVNPQTQEITEKRMVEKKISRQVKITDPTRLAQHAANSASIIGFVAQEEAAVDPALVRIGAVTPGDDDPTTITKQWQRSDAALVPILVAEIKALRARVAALEAKP